MSEDPEISENYYASLLGTKQYNRYWRHSHKQVRLGWLALAGIDKKKDQDDWDLNDVEEGEIRRYIDESVLVRAVDNFQSYVIELISKIFSAKPEMVSGNKIDVRAIFEIDDLSDLKQYAIEEMATKYSYMNIVDLDTELRSRFGFGLFNEKMRKLRIKRIVEIRNLIVHNRGIINNTFLRKTGSRFDRLSESVRFPHPVSITTYLDNAATDIDKLAKDKFCLEPEGND